jgi:uncharacterized protein YndB with AHSA1/START domain
LTTLPPIRREIIVDGDPETAFAVFTDDIGAWWPVAEHSVFGAGSTVAFEGGRIIERAADGRESVWGTVQEWEPGRSLRFTWHPGKDAESASTVRVAFHDRTDRTLVVLEHSGWEVFADPGAARAEYDNGWPAVLDQYGAKVSEAAGSTWVALMHSPRPDGPSGTSVFEDPRFRHHLDFIGQMQSAGYLVAAGPLADAPGSGLTILRLPGSGRFADAARLAEEDAAVKTGLLSVEAHDWDVMVHTLARGGSQ